MASKNAIKISRADWVLKTVAMLLTLFWIFCLFFPIYWMVISSFKDATEQYAKTPQLGLTAPLQYTMYVEYDENATEDQMYTDANILVWQMYGKAKSKMGQAEIIALKDGKPVMSVNLSKADSQINRKFLWDKAILLTSDIVRVVNVIKEKEFVDVSFDKVELPKTQKTNKWTKLMVTDFSQIEELTGTVTGCTYQKSWKNIFDNYKIAWDYPNSLGLKNGLLGPIINTLIIAVMSFIGSQFIASISAYSVAKLLPRSIKYKIMSIVLISGMVSPTLLLIPKYQVVNDLGLTNSFWGVVLPGLAGFGGMLLYKVQFDAFPDAIIEAARLDGAGELRIYFSMALPSAKALIAYSALTGFAASWGDFFWPMMILRDPEKYNLGIVINILLNGSGSAPDYSVSLALGFLISIPTLVVYGIFQKQLSYNMGIGGLKG